MTRLYHEIIKDIPLSLQELDKNLQLSTDHCLLSLSAHSISKPFKDIASEIKNYTAAVVPISSGAGVIPGFAEAVSAVLKHLGLNAYITRQPDVGGFGEALSGGADIVLAADDKQFLSINLNNRKVTDNAWATALGFAHALAVVAEKNHRTIAGQKVLVLGLGPVGCYAVLELIKLGFKVTVYDTDAVKLEAFVASCRNVQKANDIRSAMQEIRYVFDATPAAEIVNETMIGPSTVISCPGVPHGLTKGALSQIGSRLIHDNLPLGVATMVLQSIF